MPCIDELARNAGPVVFEAIDATRVAVPMHEPFRISSGEVSLKEAILVKIQGGAAFGWGESSAMPGGFYSADTPDGCQEELVKCLLPALAGRRFESMAALERYLLEQGSSPFVRVAIETAAWELVARQRGISLRKLFGIPERPVPSGLAVGLYDRDEELAAALERYKPRDYRRLKIKIKRGHDVRLVRLVRALLGDFPLFVDANADYGRDDFGVFRELDAFGLMMYEQPLAKADLEASAALCRECRTPICLDEGISSAEDTRQAIALKACGVVNIKLQRVGGFTEALRVVEICAAAGVPVWMGTMPELGVGSAQALVLAAHPAFTFPTDVEPSDRWYTGDVLAPELRLQDGTFTAPAGPGLGFTVDEAAVERYTVARWSFKV
ncbi:MAG TPA: o-succinylbenzoate synthase [Bryobacteraceae bacterium]|nr:o-succinylbenzoate synthase [Bryobacteraceae bacterium]